MGSAETVGAATLRAAAPDRHMKVLHLSGESQSLALLLAERALHVLSVQPAEAPLQRLRSEAVRRSLHNLDLISAGDLTALPLSPDNVDLIVSCLALDPLHGADKRLVMRRCRRWLRPGGRLVLADRMDEPPAAGGEIWPGRRPAEPRRSSALPHLLLGRLKGAMKRGPARSSFWLEAARDAGFVDVTYVPLRQGAGIVLARKRWVTPHNEVE